MRLLLSLFAIVAAFLLLRSLLEPLVKAIVAFLTPASPRPHAGGPSPGTVGELKKDPVCGTFVAPELAVTQSFHGQTLHFCSTKCRDEYARTA
ncbi:MAG: hypothetical protein HY236_11570 [Acidobacteria bacterium]|nr:hypothetical protein [Acidobacteriota bacterium]